MQRADVPAYAIAYLRDVDFGPEIIEYIEKIEATLTPYDGRFIVHGGPIVQVEGEWTGDVVIIEFPSATAAEEWYASPAYQEILPLRTEHSNSMAGLLRGLPEGYRPAGKVQELQELFAEAG
jgi:uncharacterized protein (DUF1330 family)